MRRFELRFVKRSKPTYALCRKQRNVSTVSFVITAVPTAELVKRVKELYHKRVSDVRFLIPVLTGLTKQEIIAVLPKLIKQSPSVVKEVFNRLLGCFHSKCYILPRRLVFNKPDVYCHKKNSGEMHVFLLNN